MQAVGDDPSWGMVKLAAIVVYPSTLVLPFFEANWRSVDG